MRADTWLYRDLRVSKLKHMRWSIGTGRKYQIFWFTFSCFNSKEMKLYSYIIYGLTLALSLSYLSPRHTPRAESKLCWWGHPTVLSLVICSTSDDWFTLEFLGAWLSALTEYAEYITQGLMKVTLTTWIAHLKEIPTRQLWIMDNKAYYAWRTVQMGNGRPKMCCTDGCWAQLCRL